jgi:alcohol dehydrogenase
MGYKVGDTVLISCISNCSNCYYCKRGLLAHCSKAGWILGHTTDGTQAEYVRIPLADSSLFHAPKGVDLKALVMLSDIVPTGHEVGVLAGTVMPGKTVAIVGSGPVGLGALLTAKLYSPSLVIMIDKDQSRLAAAKSMGADVTCSPEDAEDVVKQHTNGVGCDVVMEAVGIPATFELAQNLVNLGGNIANIGVHGKEAVIHLEKLWGYNCTITMGLVNTTSTPTLMKMFESGTLDLKKLITHGEFSFESVLTVSEGS